MNRVRDSRLEQNRTDLEQDHLDINGLTAKKSIDELALSCRTKMGSKLMGSKLTGAMLIEILDASVNARLADEIGQLSYELNRQEKDRTTWLMRAYDTITRRSRNASNAVVYKMVYEALGQEEKIKKIPDFTLPSLGRSFKFETNIDFWTKNSLQQIDEYFKNGAIPTPPTSIPLTTILTSAQREAVYQEVINHPAYKIFLSIRKLYTTASSDMYKREVLFNKNELEKGRTMKYTNLTSKTITSPVSITIDFTHEFWKGKLVSDEKIKTVLTTNPSAAGVTTTSPLTTIQVDLLFKEKEFTECFSNPLEKVTTYVRAIDKNRGMEESPELLLIQAHLRMHPEDLEQVIYVFDTKEQEENQKKADKMKQDLEVLDTMIKIQAKYKKKDGQLSTLNSIAVAIRSDSQKEQIEKSKAEKSDLSDQWDVEIGKLSDIHSSIPGMDATTLQIDKEEIPHRGTTPIASATLAKFNLEYRGDHAVANTYTKENPAPGTFYEAKKKIDVSSKKEKEAGDKLKTGTQISAREMLFRLRRARNATQGRYHGLKALDRETMVEVYTDLVWVEQEKTKLSNIQFAQIFLDARDGNIFHFRDMLNWIDKGYAGNNLISKNAHKFIGYGFLKLFTEGGASFKSAKDNFFQQTAENWLDNVKNVLSKDQTTEDGSTMSAMKLSEITLTSNEEDIKKAVKRGKLDTDKLYVLSTTLALVLETYEIGNKTYKIEDRHTKNIVAFENLIGKLQRVRAEMIGDKLADELEPVVNEERAKKLTELFNAQITKDAELLQLRQTTLEPENAEWKKGVWEQAANKFGTAKWTEKKAGEFKQWLTTDNAVSKYVHEHGLGASLGTLMNRTIVKPLQYVGKGIKATGNATGKGIKYIAVDAPVAVYDGITGGAKKMGTKEGIAYKTLSAVGKAGKFALMLTPFGLGWKFSQWVLSDGTPAKK